MTERTARSPNRVALVAGRSRLTYAALDAMSDSLAGTLVDHAIQRGDRLAIFSDTWGEAVVALLAALKAGAVACPLNPLTTAESLAGLLRAWRARALVTEARLASAAALAIRTAESVRLVILAGTQRQEPAAGCIRFEDAIARREPAALAGGSPGDIALVLADERPDAPPTATLFRHQDVLALMTAEQPRRREEDAVITSLRLGGRRGLCQLFGAIRDGVTLMHSSGGVADARPLAPSVASPRPIHSTR